MMEIDSRRMRARAALPWILALAIAAGLLGIFVIVPGMARMSLIGRGRTGVRALAELEEQYNKSAGTYTDDLEKLLAIEPDGPVVARGLPYALNRASIRLTAGHDSITIQAEALDAERTVLHNESSHGGHP